MKVFIITCMKVVDFIAPSDWFGLSLLPPCRAYDGCFPVISLSILITSGTRSNKSIEGLQKSPRSLWSWYRSPELSINPHRFAGKLEEKVASFELQKDEFCNKLLSQLSNSVILGIQVFNLNEISINIVRLKFTLLWK